MARRNEFVDILNIELSMLLMLSPELWILDEGSVGVDSLIGDFQELSILSVRAFYTIARALYAIDSPRMIHRRQHQGL